jgi:phosphoglycolate phosphatase-like HAD superfamily hydrolase
MKRPVLKAVCFDFRGVILDHKTNKEIVPGIERLLRALKAKGIMLALVSRFPAEILRGMLGPIHRFFESDIYSAGDSGKLACIKEFARKLNIKNLAEIASRKR